MQDTAEHVHYQLSNEHSRVGFLLEGIQCSDPGLQAAMARVKTDNGPEGMRNNLEASAANLLPYHPVVKKRSSGYKRGSTQISSLMEVSDATIVEFWGLPPLILFFNMSIGWFGRFALSTECYRTRKLGYKNLSWPRCSPRVTESLAQTDGGFCQKQTLYISDYVKLCEFMMCILIVNHQFNRMHPWCSWECMLPGRCSPG